MASPYALDFSPINEAIDSNRQFGLLKNKLAMEQERLGWERDKQPLLMENLGLEVSQRKAMNPLELKAKEQGIEAGADEALKRKAGAMAGFIQTQKLTDPSIPADVRARNWEQTLSHPMFANDPGLNNPAYAKLLRDPNIGPHIIVGIARGYQDEGKEALTRAQTTEAAGKGALYSSQAANQKVQVNPVTGEYYDQKGPMPAPAGSENRGALIFGKKYAETEAPKLHAESSKLYTDAADTHAIMSSLEELAPFAKTGFGGPQLLQLRKLGAQFGIKDESIAPTELFQFLAQKGVFELTKQLKPASNLDMIASERATASLQSDPSTLPAALPVLKAIAQRSMMKHQLDMEFYKRGMPPDTPAIMAEVNRQIPFDLSGVTKVQNGPAAGPRVQKQSTDALPQGPTVGSIKTGRDGIPYRFKGGNPADANSWERAQ